MFFNSLYYQNKGEGCAWACVHACVHACVCFWIAVYSWSPSSIGVSVKYSEWNVDGCKCVQWVRWEKRKTALSKWFELIYHPPWPTEVREETHSHGKCPNIGSYFHSVPLLLVGVHLCKHLCVVVWRLTQRWIKVKYWRESSAEGGVDDRGEVMHMTILLTSGPEIKTQGAPTPGE